MENVLVIAVHPDDETLGCGGTLLKHKHKGDKIHWLIATNMKIQDGFTQKEIDIRNKEIDKVASLYNFDSVHCLELSATRVDSYHMSDLVSAISPIFNLLKPNKVYLPFKNDVHSDHRKIFESAYTCTKSFRYPFIKKVLMMETLSETEFSPSISSDAFVPNVYVDITAYFQKKLDIMSIYKSEMGRHPFPRSIDNITALAIYRGAVAGCTYAESFMLLKEIS